MRIGHFLHALGAAAMLLSAIAARAEAKDWKRVVIATEGAYPPYNMHAPDGALVGFEIDLAADLCRRMEVECPVVGQDWDGMIPALNAGKFDAIMSAMSVTPKRMEVIAFSTPYVNSPTTFATLKGSPLANLPMTETRTPLADAAALKAALDAIKPKLRGQTIGVQVSTIQADFLNTYLKDTVTVRTYPSAEDHDLDLEAGRVDAVLASAGFLRGALDKNPDMAFTGPLFTGGLLGVGSAVGLRKADPELKAMFDGAIRDALADGTIKKLSVKWFKIDLSP